MSKVTQTPPGGPAPKGADYCVRMLSDTDLNAIVEIHAAAFPEAALTAFGREAIRRQYNWYLLGPHDSVCAGAYVAGRLAGFCFSGVFRGATGGFIRKNRSYLVGQIARRPWLLWNPLVRNRARIACRALNPFRQSRNPNAEAPWWDQYSILAIAVDPDQQGSGIGAALMKHAEMRAVEKSVPRLLLSVNPENKRAVRFYETLGWTRSGEREPWTGEMRKSLNLDLT